MFDIPYGPKKSFKEICDSFFEFGYLTGSRAFGTNRLDSDYDFMFCVVDNQRVADMISGYSTVPSDYNSGFKIEVDNKTINFIPLHPHAMLPWMVATQALKSVIKDVPSMNDPLKKYCFFEAMVCSLRGLNIPQGDTKSYEKEWRDFMIKNPSKINVVTI